MDGEQIYSSINYKRKRITKVKKPGRYYLSRVNIIISNGTNQNNHAT